MDLLFFHDFIAPILDRSWGLDISGYLLMNMKKQLTIFKLLGVGWKKKPDSDGELSK